MADHTLTRRGILGAMALVPMAISAPVHAASTEFTSLLAAYKNAAAIEQQYDRTFCEAAQARFDNLSAAVPHASVRWESNPHFAGETWSTANARHVREARYFLDPNHAVAPAPGQSSYRSACIALIAAVDRREAALKRAREESGIDAVLDESERLQEVTCRARDAVINCPISTAAELAEKITFIAEHDQWDYDKTRDAVASDAQRLASQVRQMGHAA